MSCKKVITLISKDEPVKIALFDGEKHCIIELSQNSKIKKNISEYKSGLCVYIRNSNYNVLYTLSEPDHWFPTKHSIRFVITSEGIEEDYGMLRGRKENITGENINPFEKNNVDYIENVLGEIVINYISEYKKVPDSFDIALESTKGNGPILEYRGDVNGDPISYEKIDESSFSFHSFGKNGKDENKQGDDIYLVYRDGIWNW